MRVGLDHEFDAPAETVFEMMCSPDFHVVKSEHSGHEDVEIVSVEEIGAGASVTTRQRVTVDLPGFARHLFDATNTVTTVDSWTDSGDGTFCGTYVMDTQGLPLDVEGTAELEAVADNPGRTRYSVSIDVTVDVPVIGGRLAKWGKRDIEGEIRQQFAAGDTWLAR